MPKKNIDIVKKIIAKATQEKVDKITYNTKSEDIMRWDSLAQIKILNLLEENFNKKINTTKASSLKSVKEICEFLD